MYLWLDKEGLTVRGARDPRLGQASGECDPAEDTILTGSSGFEIRAAGITVEHFCFQNIDDGSLAHAAPHNLAPIRVQDTATAPRSAATASTTPSAWASTAAFRKGDLNNLTIAENEFIDIGLIETNGADTPIQPRGTGAEPSAIRIDTSFVKNDLNIVGNLFEGSAFAGLNLVNVQGGSISGNTFRDMAKSAVNLNGSSDVTLDNNTFEGNNRVAWRVFETADWLNDLKVGPWGPSVANKTASMESEALQDLLRLTKAEAEELEWTASCTTPRPRIRSTATLASTPRCGSRHRPTSPLPTRLHQQSQQHRHLRRIRLPRRGPRSGRRRRRQRPRTRLHLAQPGADRSRIDCHPERQPVQRQRHPQLRRAPARSATTS